MSFSTPFLADLELKTPVTWQWFVQAVDLNGLEEVYAGPISIGTHPDLNGNAGTDAAGAAMCLMDGPPMIQGQQLSIRDWTTTTGTTTITIVGDVSEARKRITRGTVMEVRMGKVGQLSTQYTRIALGRVMDAFVGGPRTWTLTLSDALSILAHRPSSGYSATKVGGVVGYTLSSDYAPGDSTIGVTSTTNFDYESGGTGLAYVVPTNGDEPFFVTFTGAGAVNLTGVNTAGGAFGTTQVAVTVADGGTVYDCVHVQDHPIDAVRKVWQSTGTPGSNGTWDTLPSQWGYAISQGLFDNDDMTNERDSIMVPASGSYTVALWSEVNVESPGDWWREFLAAFACYPTFRQGLITIRAASMDSGRKRTPVLQIDDGDIIPGSNTLIAAHDGSKDEAGRVYVVTGTGEGVDDYSVYATAPIVYADSYDATRWCWLNESAIRTEILERVTVYHCRLPELWEVRVAGVRCLQLTVGDWVWVSSSVMVGRLDYGSSYGGVSARAVELVQVAVDFSTWTTTLRFIAWPDDPENEIFPS